jgi:hypothetical protein
MPLVAEVSTAPNAMAGARAAKKRKKIDAWLRDGCTRSLMFKLIDVWAVGRG